ncbi:MAG: hypothetical protein WA994_02180 [Ornithinimicrobium sp.]
MTNELQDYFLFIGSTDTEAATTRLRAAGALYRKKMLNSRPENWVKIVALAASSKNRGTLVVLTGSDYQKICDSTYTEVAVALLNSLAKRPHIILVHEAVFLTDEQRSASEAVDAGRAALVNVTPRFSDEDYYGMTKEEFFGALSDDIRQRVNAMMRERSLNVVPYRTNVERSVIASAFVEDHERHLLFRLYVPNGRLYAQEAESLLGMFREWLSQTGRQGIRQEGYKTDAGQVYELFGGEEDADGDGLRRYFADFSDFLGDCVSQPEVAITEMTAAGLAETAAGTIVSRFAIQARRLTLDLRQRREERVLSLKHQLENVMLEADGAEDDAVMELLDVLLPAPIPGAVVPLPAASPVSPVSVTNIQPQFIHQISGTVIQSVGGTIHLGPEAHQLLELIARHGGSERPLLETAVHELEDEGARAGDRIVAKGRLKRFLADLGNRGLSASLNILQKYVEHKIGMS